MENKFDWKSFEDDFILVFIATAGVSFLIFLVFPVIFQSQAQFSIYKEECWNETGHFDVYNCEDGLGRVSPYEQQYDEIVDDGVRCFKNNDTWEEQVCEKKEVEEIAYNREEFINCEVTEKVYINANVTKMIIFHSEAEIEKGASKVDRYCIRDYRNKVIPKSDLTEKWLGENCRCIDAEKIEFYNWECNNTDKNNLITSITRDNPFPDNCNFYGVVPENSNCIQYKCGEYFVEKLK